MDSSPHASIVRPSLWATDSMESYIYGLPGIGLVCWIESSSYTCIMLTYAFHFFYSVMRYSASYKAMLILLDGGPYSVLARFITYSNSRLMLLQMANGMWWPTFTNWFSRREQHLLVLLKNVRIFPTSIDLLSCHSSTSLDVFEHLIILLVRIVHTIKFAI